MAQDGEPEFWCNLKPCSGKLEQGFIFWRIMDFDLEEYLLDDEDSGFAVADLHHWLNKSNQNPNSNVVIDKNDLEKKNFGWKNDRDFDPKNSKNENPNR
jgi:hypothetical protein